MTLVLTELSSCGIVMAADSAVTLTGSTFLGGNKVYWGANKLQLIPYLQAGVSMWGIGNVNRVPVDDLVADFITSQDGKIRSLKEFVESLAELMRKALGTGQFEEATGFHVAGYVERDGKKLVNFWHIHNVANDQVEPWQLCEVRANEDIPPREMGNQIYYTRNGDYRTLYAQLFEYLKRLLGDIRQDHEMEIPYPQDDLSKREEFVRFQIQTVSSLYQMSNLVPSIGGPVSTLTINEYGIQSFKRQ